jgi:phenylpropionate dioxygenase-like ring-hydroxylating dioxygenase large terminal subunit
LLDRTNGDFHHPADREQFAVSSTTAAASLNIGELILADRVHGRVYHDADLFQREMHEIFGKVWVYLGHASEVPNNGDYVRRQIGLQPVILVHGKDGELRVFFNRCRHRANLVCHHQRGNEPVFRCPYHGWTYSNQGELIAPTFDEAYEEGLSNEEFGLTPVPRVQSYRGLVFASASPQGISLDEHLGGAKEFLDLIIDRSPQGEIELSAGTQKMRYLANWKMLPENSLEGGYHGHFIHKFAFDLFDSRTGRNRMELDEESIRYLPGGHMVEDFRHVQYHPRQEPSPARKDYVEMLVKTYGAQRMEELTFGRAPIMFVFPNLMFVQTHIRRLQPVSVNETYVYYQPVMLKGVPPQINHDIIRSHETSFGPAGFLSPDDIEVMERNQIGLQARGNEWLFIGRGIHRENRLADGGTIGHDMDENQLRGLWQHYARLMSGA